jgi:hypothetical protein
VGNSFSPDESSTTLPPRNRRHRRRRHRHRHHSEADDDDDEEEEEEEERHPFGFLARALPSLTKDGAPPLLAPAPHKLSWNGLDCRLGWERVLSEAHYDFKRNFIALVGGHKRYFLLPPSACDALALLPFGHPSARHSKIRLVRLGGVLSLSFSFPRCLRRVAMCVCASEGPVEGGRANTSEGSTRR